MATKPRRLTDGALAAHATALEGAFWRTLAGPERALEKELAAVWNKWAARAVDAVARDADPIATLNAMGFLDAAPPLRARAVAVMGMAAALVRGLADQLKDADAFVAARVRYAAQMSLTRARGFQDAQKAIIQRELANAASSGRNPRAAAKDLEAALGGLVGRSRARTIARTELHAAASWAQWQEATRAAEAYGIGFLKEWRSTHDHRVRPSHALANGQRIALDASFVVGGAALRFPGDPNGPGREVINCRCVAIYVPTRLADRIPQAAPIGGAAPDIAPAAAPVVAPAAPAEPVAAPGEAIDLAADTALVSDRAALWKALEKVKRGPLSLQRSKATAGRRWLLQFSKASSATEITREEALAVDIVARAAAKGPEALAKVPRVIRLAADRAAATFSIDSTGGRLVIDTASLAGKTINVGDTFAPGALRGTGGPMLAQGYRARAGETIFVLRNAENAVPVDIKTPFGRPRMLPQSTLEVVGVETRNGVRVVTVDAKTARAWDHAAIRSALSAAKSPEEIGVGGSLAEANAIAAKAVKDNGARTGWEWIATVDQQTGRVLLATSKDAGSVGMPFDLTDDEILNSTRRFVVHHNHPEALAIPLSPPDLKMARYSGFRGIAAHTPNGSLFYAEVRAADELAFKRLVGGLYSPLKNEFYGELLPIRLDNELAFHALMQEAIDEGLGRAGLLLYRAELSDEAAAFFEAHRGLLERMIDRVKRDAVAANISTKAAGEAAVLSVLIDPPKDKRAAAKTRRMLRATLTGDELDQALADLDAYAA